ncbi:MAG: toxin, partial [Polyangiaceae bacterium]|nr:toxin [Polyangiaceae bacterium]
MQDRNGSNDTPGYLPAPVPNGREQEPRDGWKGEAPKPVESRTPPKQQEGPRATFAAVKPPSLNLPKGGGALRGIGETFKTNPVTGTASAQIPLPITPAPHGPSPELTLSYDSGSGNGLFGLGWGVGVPQIARKTDKQLPEYLDREDSDIFILGGDDLVPRFKEDQLNGWVRDNGAATEGTVDYSIERFRPRTEGAFSKVERWTNTDTLESHWRVTSRDNATSFFGRTTESRIAGPEQSTIDPKKPQRVYSWLLDRVVDDRGHVVEYRYAAEDLTGVSATKCSEAARVDGLVAVENRHLKRVLYGNRNVWPTATPDFKLELVFDYGEHHATTPLPNDDVSNDWTVRQDPFSSFRAGFDMRTYRLCRRVLMFHRFTELHSTEPTLVRALELTYAATPKVTQLTSAKMRGFTRDGSSYTSADLPALALTYTEAAFTRDIEALGEGDALDFNPQSLTKFAQWVDLDGEGLPGVLTDRGGALHYKRNLGDGHLDGSVQLPSAPNLSLRDRGSAQLMDVAGSGNMSVVKLDPGASGYFEREGDGWAPFRTFASNPNIDWADPNLRMVDLNGDGFDDILITRGDYLIWYPSLARDGYGPPQRVPLPREEERGPTVIFAGRYSSIFLADMNGDGLADLVQVLHSRVAYWPNLGHGRFGAQIVMDDSPQIDAPHLFHPSRVRLADLDGTGTADLVYFDTGGMHVWPNLSGNAFGTKLTNECFPVPEGLPTLAIIDLHGVGMSTFAWAPKRGTTEPVRHTSPFGKKKPFLLQSMENGMGLEVRFEYASSTKFYLADREAGRPWATKLPFPVQVLTKVESYDAISKTRLVSKYAYHHGHYDTLEREFRGFGMVEQVDAETFDDAQGSTLFPNLPVANGELSQPPVLSKSWFHLGAWLEQKSLETAFSAEYWDGDTGAPNPLTCIVEPGLKPDELPEAHRALRGTLLRQEVFGHTRVGNAWALDAIPFSVTSASYEVRRIQPRLPAAGADRPRLRGVFHTVERESRDHYYDRVANDPRFSQTLALDVDDYGVVTRRAAIAYPRRTSSVHAEQNEIHCVVTETDVVHLDAETTGYRLAVPLETRAYELTGLSTSTLYTPESLESDYGDATPRAYHDGLEGGLERRIVERVMVVYYDSDLTNPLLPGQTNLRALPYETYHLDLTDDLLADVMGDKVTSDMLSNGKYAEFNDDGNHWIPSGRSVPNASRFYLPDSYRDPFGSVTTVTYDAHDFFVTEMEDALDNTVVADIDYRVFAPSLVTDPNGNRVEAAFDPLGRVTKVAVMGKTTESLGDTLADPTETFEYALDRWSQGKPNYSKHRAREQHGSANPRWQESYVYTDGSGRVAMAKIQAEAGEAHQYDSQTGEVIRDTETGAPVLAVTSTRWVGTGKTVLNNKGNPVKQYEPFFSPTHEYEDEEDLTQIGVTSIVTYDAVGRATRVDLPDETFSTTSWTPWTQVVADENDNETGGDHENTPTVTHVDTMGRPFLVVADNGNTELFEMRTTLDIEGQVLAVTDQLGRICQTNKFSMAGRLLYETNIDKGERWNLTAADGAPIQRWDKRDQVFRWEYDELRRPTHLWVKIGTADEVLLERRYYGDNPNLTTPEADNLRGRPILLFDGAGKTEVGPYDFKGNVKESSRTLASTYDAIVDWSDLATVTNPATAESTAAADLESETWTETREYDALGRITSLIAPDISEFLPAYNEANLLESVAVKVRGATSATTFVSDIDYNAKGQRLSIAYGNGVTTQYTYDPKRFRLTRLLTTRTSPTSATLQDLNYSYDPVGNIIGIEDDALQTVFFANQVVDGSQTFTYDATYRLIAASGREH